MEEREFEARREIYIKKLLNERRKKHEKEITTTLGKIKNGLDELEQNKANEERKLHKKISFLSKNLENLQIQEYNSFERDVKNFNKDANITKGSHYSSLIKKKSIAPRKFMLK